MTAKRFSKYVPDSYGYTSAITIVDHETSKQCGNIDDVVDLLNEQHEKIEFVSLLANHRGEMIAFANSLIQDLDDETERDMWETFKEEMWQKWKKQRGIE